MSKITVTPITNANNLTNINNNFSSLATELNDKVLYRNNPSGEANQMMNSLDMNGNDVLNIGDINVQGISVGGIDLIAELDTAVASSESSAATALAAATSSNTSALAAAASAASASGTLAGAMLKANNLSDVASVAAAKTNLSLVKADVGLGSVDNTADTSKPVSTAQQTALNLKANAANAALTGTTSAAAITATGLISPSSTVGIKGTVTNDNVQAGSIGEYMETLQTTASAFTSGTTTTTVGVILTAGDWDVDGAAYFTPAGGTGTIGRCFTGISTTAGTFNGGAPPYYVDNVFSAANAQQAQVAPTRRITLTTTTTVSLVINCTSSTALPTFAGYIRARRVR